MSRLEISQFLNLSENSVEQLWKSGELLQTISVYIRPDWMQAFSSIYDVLEFSLYSGSQFDRISREDAALWVTEFSEIYESHDHGEGDFPSMASELLESAKSEGLAPQREQALTIAERLIETHRDLVDFCGGGQQKLYASTCRTDEGALSSVSTSSTF